MDGLMFGFERAIRSAADRAIAHANSDLRELFRAMQAALGGDV